MLTRETCDVCKGAFGYRWTDHEKPTEVRMCAAEYDVLEVSVDGAHAGYGYQPDTDGALIVRHPRGHREQVTGLTYLGAKRLTLESWVEAGNGAFVGPLLDAAVRAWLALPLEERCPS